MQVSNVTNEDGVRCIELLKALDKARFTDLSGRDMVAFQSARQWIGELAREMGQQLKAANLPATASKPSESFKIKSIGSLPARPKSSKKKKAK